MSEVQWNRDGGSPAFWIDIAMPHQEQKPGESITGAQVAGGRPIILTGAFEALHNPLPVTYGKLRELRRDPTIALIRAVAASPAILGDWSVTSKDGTDPNRVDFIRDQLLGLRPEIMQSAMYYGHIDFGWVGWEKIFENRGGRVVLRRLKALLHDITEVMVTQGGGFAGFSQERDGVVVPVENALFIGFRVEGTQWYGTSLLENVRKAVDRWNVADDSAARYDKKLAGASLHIKVPPGKTTSTGITKGPKGAVIDTDNRAIGDLILQQFLSGFGMVTTKTGNPDQDWEIDIIGDSKSRQASFVPRLQYLDNMKARGLLVPERAAFEARFGTRADAKNATDVGLTIITLAIEHITSMVNWHLVDQLLALNWGDDARGSVWLETAPLADAKLDRLKDLFQAVIANPAGLVQVFGLMDIEAIMDQLGVPTQADGQVDLPPLDDVDPDSPAGVTLNRIHSFVNDNGR